MGDFSAGQLDYIAKLNGLQSGTTQFSTPFVTDRISVGGVDSGVSMRSAFSGNSEQYVIGVRFSSAGGSIYFGAKSASSTPDGAISNASGSTIVTFENSRRVFLDAGQLGFPAAQNPSSDANTLDDYEEGTYTPTISSSSGTITTKSANVCWYVKNGQLVVSHANVTITTAGTGAGFLQLTTPFTPNASGNSIGSADSATTSLGGSSQMNASTATMFVTKYDGTSFIASGANILAQNAFRI